MSGPTPGRTTSEFVVTVLALGLLGALALTLALRTGAVPDALVAAIALAPGPYVAQRGYLKVRSRMWRPERL